MASLLSHLFPLATQSLAVLAGLVVLVAMPPVQGSILLVSLTGRPVADIANAALATGARITGRGPGGHGLVVFGERARLFEPARGLIPIAAPASWCGA